MAHLLPIPTTFTSVVASREFTIVSNGAYSTVAFEIGLPIQDVETVAGMDWRCPLRIKNGTSINQRNACGVDSLQAIANALRIMRYEIEKIGQDCTITLFDAPYTPEEYDIF